MLTGYVAFLDVLGFSALISGDRGVDDYLQCLEDVFHSEGHESPVEYVAFSDSIVLTTKDGSDDALRSLLLACSKVFGAMLDKRIPLRGAVAFGPYIRSETSGGVFVAGKAIIEAYQFEG